MDGTGADEPRPHDVIDERYELISIVGSGGMGVVYRARDRVLDRTVAVKVIRQELVDEDFIRRFEREAAVLARVRSPHIVVVFDYGSTNGQFYLVTDFLPDGDLADWLTRNGPMDPGQALPLMASLADGLADAHENGVIHRDVKPGNVLLWRRGTGLHPVLADFGIAVTADLGLTVTGGVVGSPPFMAPERHLGQPATETTDVYAMGCMLYNVLTGEPPYRGTNFQAANSHINDPVPTLPPTVPHADRIDPVIARCMAKRPEERYASAAELAAALRSALPPVPLPPEPTPARQGEQTPGGNAPTTVVSRPPAPAPTTRRPGRSRAALGAAVGVLVLGLVAAAGAWWLARDPEGTAAPDSAPTATGTPPAAPGEVDAETERGDRAVAVAVDLPPPPTGGSVVVERQDEEGVWRTSEPTFEVATDQGGDRACAVVRLVAVADGLRTAGPQRRVCGRAAARTIKIVPVPGTPCSGRTPSGAPVPCDWFDILLRGFETGTALTLQWEFRTGDLVSRDPARASVIVGADGTTGFSQHQGQSTYGGLCPDRLCPAGLFIPRAAEEVVVRAYRDGTTLEMTQRIDLAQFR